MQPTISRSGLNIRSWDSILYDECGKQLETSKAAKALIEAFKYIQNNEKY